MLACILRGSVKCVVCNEVRAQQRHTRSRVNLYCRRGSSRALWLRLLAPSPSLRHRRQGGPQQPRWFSQCWALERALDGGCVTVTLNGRRGPRSTGRPCEKGQWEFGGKLRRSDTFTKRSIGSCAGICRLENKPGEQHEDDIHQLERNIR